jgi:hypothetical protein
MKLFRIAVVLLTLLVVCPAQQEGQSSGKIIVRMLNGRTGKPIRRKDNINVWLGDAKTFSLLLTDAKGEITIDIGNIQPFEIRVHPGNYVDCRFKGYGMDGRSVRYSLEEITSQGVVSENVCGKTRVPPTPGVLVVYVRPLTLIEGMKV